MWRKEDGNPQSPSANSPNPAPPPGFEKSGVPAGSAQATNSKAPACVSQGIKIKGEVEGSEDLFVDGVIEGKITLGNAAITVGPNGNVKADISARELVLRGRAEGKFTAIERIQIWSSARVEGDLKSERISIEDGALFRGKVEAGKAPAGAKAVEDTGRGHNKKGEGNKTKDVQSKHTDEVPGAASAGAD